MKPITALEQFMYHTVAELTSSFKEEVQPLWGTMNATEMLDHLSLTFRASNGLVTAPLSSEPEKALKLKQIVLLSERPLMKNFDNPVLAMAPRPEKKHTHEQAKESLQENIRLFRKTFEGREDSLTYVHNMFGPLDYHEWLWFHYKHINHHFAQFALVPYTDRFVLQ